MFKNNIFLKRAKKDEKGTHDLGLSVEKLSLSNTISIEALIELLSKKGLITKEEVLEEVRKIGKSSKLYKEE
ncbi:MAG: hypothetical protein JXR48_00335 [Candidatus Delongbacteria bacterium]|nr:hypothetical protein [Candidatus Delongbacteria bacterium]MBN2833391.1 hypothetical protein [Candidatus Delongbacteria bacterium]